MPEEIYEGQGVDEHILAYTKDAILFNCFWSAVIEYKKKQSLVTCIDYTQSFIKKAFEGDKSVEIPGTLKALANLKRVIELPSTVVADYRSARKIISGYGRLRDIGVINPSNSAEAAAAFGTFFSGIGGLAKYLPPPVNAYLGIFQDAENFFTNVRAQMQPGVHVREPGLRDELHNAGIDFP